MLLIKFGWKLGVTVTARSPNDVNDLARILQQHFQTLGCILSSMAWKELKNNHFEKRPQVVIP